MQLIIMFRCLTLQVTVLRRPVHSRDICDFRCVFEAIRHDFDLLVLIESGAVEGVTLNVDDLEVSDSEVSDAEFPESPKS